MKLKSVVTKSICEAHTWAGTVITQDQMDAFNVVGQKANSNYFRYQHPITGEIITEREEPGWNIKSFTILPKPYRFWLCVGAESLRLSLGFRYYLPEN